MEDTLRELEIVRNEQNNGVLILVLMEDTLRASVLLSIRNIYNES